MPVVVCGLGTRIKQHKDSCRIVSWHVMLHAEAQAAAVEAAIPPRSGSTIGHTIEGFGGVRGASPALLHAALHKHDLPTETHMFMQCNAVQCSPIGSSLHCVMAARSQSVLLNPNYHDQYNQV